MLYILLFILLFLKPSLDKKYIGQQIGRLVIGLFFSWLVFYIGNEDRTLSFVLAALWLPALVQAIFVLASFKNKDKTAAPVFIASLAMFLFSVLFNNFPYITGGANKLAEMVPVKESSDKISKIDAAHVIVISPETAYYEMQKMLGTLPNPSVYRIGELGITMTKDGAAYVAPIEVDGFFRSLTNKEIPGVMFVSAEKADEAKVIKVPSKISESLFLSRDLERYMRANKQNSILFQANVELDNEGSPYYVGSYGHYQYGRKGPVIDGVLLYSFKDDKVADYSKDKIPEWVDEVYPSDVSELYNDFFGTLQRGLFNKWFAKSGVHIPTRWSSDTSVKGLEVNSTEVTGVIDADGQMKWFTDHTNTSDASTTLTGYSLMNMRNGQMVYYTTPGFINGKGAMNAVDKALGANKSNWAPTQPLFYNLFGTEAWVVPVVNKTDGALIKIAIVAAQNSYVVLEDSKDAAIESFKSAIAYGKISDESNRNANSIKAEEKLIKGTVSRINAVSENGNTLFYVKLADNNTIFMVSKTAGIDVVLTKENDSVEIKYLDIKDTSIVSTTSFKNNSIK